MAYFGSAGQQTWGVSLAVQDFDIAVAGWIETFGVERGLSKCVVRIEAFIIDEVDFETGSWFSR